MVATYRQPFDLLAETAATATRAAAGDTPKTAKTEIWLGQEDSNLDRRNRSASSAMTSARFKLNEPRERPPRCARLGQHLGRNQYDPVGLQVIENLDR